MFSQKMSNSINFVSEKSEKVPFDIDRKEIVSIDMAYSDTVSE